MTALVYPEPQTSRDKAVGQARAVVTEILEERLAQVDVHGRSHSLDDAYVDGQLALAAGAYALAAANQNAADLFWPWPGVQWNPADPRRNLVRAAALCAAEIERLDRMASKPAEVTP